MWLLAILLSWGWPKERTVWVAQGTPVPAGMLEVRLSNCCGSMKPAIKGGEIAFVEPYHGQRGLLGCIIATDVMHRVVAETAEAVKTSGDANRFSDPWIAKAKIRYIVRYIVRK